MFSLLRTSLLNHSKKRPRFKLVSILLFSIFYLTCSISIDTTSLTEVSLINQAKADAFTALDPDLNLEGESGEGDENKSAPELVREANYLFLDEKPLEARVKLFKALEKDKTHYPTYILLGEYYIEHVGHFRLALKYIKRATELFYEQKGKPPFDDSESLNDHARLLYLLTQVKLNLDDYQGSLKVLDEFTSYGYFGNWYPATRAWVLMKLGDIKEAIAVARTGLLMGADDGRTLNMLGILLSLDNSPEEALKALRSAIAYELSQGRNGRPATPLNNSGEVYRELYEDDKAESSWRKALRLPDGCEHILPTVNLSLLLMEQLRISETQQALDDFVSCVSQYTLRNGEEHKALEALFRARVELASGRPLSAQQLLQSSLQGIQWFGKIGTNKEDLEVAALVTLAESLRATNAVLSTTLTNSYLEAAKNLAIRSINSTKRWWLLRKARGLLVDTLKNIEDLHIRNTDSMLDYSSLGEILSTFPPDRLKQRIETELKSDSRPRAKLAYDLYYAESLANHGEVEDAVAIAQSIISDAKSRYDEGISLRAKLLVAKSLDKYSKQYIDLTQNIFNTLRPALRFNDLTLPVQVISDNDELKGLLEKVGFLVINDGSGNLRVKHIKGQDDERIELFTVDPSSPDRGQSVLAFTSLKQISQRAKNEENQRPPGAVPNMLDKSKDFKTMSKTDLFTALINDFSNQVFSLGKK